VNGVGFCSKGNDVRCCRVGSSITDSNDDDAMDDEAQWKEEASATLGLDVFGSSRGVDTSCVSCMTHRGKVKRSNRIASSEASRVMREGSG
jgi:hypothetical protein